jgi:UDP-N-acetylmuramoyl-tripeptide--D-alanyl-D-alanine ligase
LNLLDELEGRKVAVLGDMLELGPYEQRGHEMVGVRAAEVAEEVITIGPLAHIIARAAWEAGMPKEAITELEDTQSAIAFLQQHLKPGDVVLVKGSHGMRLDRIVTALEASE